MPRRARVHYVSLHSSLINLPISIYGPLLERSIRPQNLAVHLTLVPQENGINGRVSSTQKGEAYVGWTGMASASSLAHFSSLASGEKGLETIEIDPQYAQGLGLAQGDVVDIGLLHDLPMAKSVGTEPLTSDDWEIIEIHASHVESTLLSQVRVAKIGQEIDVWVLGRTRVRLRVVSLDPSTKNNALLLTTNTEVSIAPKLRSTSHKSPSSTSKPSSTPVDSASENAKQITKGKLSTQILRVLPTSSLSSLKLDTEEYTAPEPLAYVSPYILSQLTHTPLPLPAPTSEKSEEEKTFYKVSWRRLRPPPNPVESSSTSPSSPSPAPAPKVLNPGASTTPVGKDADTANASEKKNEIWLGCSEAVLESHILFPITGMVDGVNEWDLVRVTVMAEPESTSYSQLFSNSDTRQALQNGNAVKAPSESQPKSFLAGVDSILDQCSKFCRRSLALHAEKSFVRGVSALLLTGRSGAGKTSIVQAVAKSLQEDSRTYTYTHYVDLSKYSEQPVPTLKSLFRYWFEKCQWHRPSILILDNIEKILGAEVEHADSFRTRQLTELFLLIYSASARSATPNFRGIILLATAQSQAALHPLLGTAHIFNEIVKVNPPNKDARRDIITRIVQDRLAIAPDIKLDRESPLNYTALATQTEGYSATDLQDLVARAVHQAAIRTANITAGEDVQTTLSSADFEVARKDFVPLSLREVSLQKSDVEWSDIGGLQETKQVLRETLEWPTKYGPIFAQSPLRLRSGLLLYGFPGCGKTLLASAVAKECGLNFISVKGPELLNKYIGASEKSVRDLFERASAAKPCVLFFDEFDSIAPKRGHDSTGVTDRVVNQMLTQMDGAEGLDGVYVLAATSRPDLIDGALLRPGRLDKSLFCDMPDLVERKDILRAVSRKVILSPSVNLDEVAAATEGYSGADLQALVYNAHLEVVHASISSVQTAESRTPREDEKPIEYAIIGGPKEKGIASKAEEAALQRRLQQIKSSSQKQQGVSKDLSTKPKQHEITDVHLRRVLETTRPSVSPEERHRLGQIYKGFVSDRSGRLPVPPDAGGVGSRSSLM